MYWMPAATFPVESDVRKDVVYGYDLEFTGLLDIDNPNGVTTVQNVELELVPDTPATPPGPTDGDIEYA